jgi:hypothetical protein
VIFLVVFCAGHSFYVRTSKVFLYIANFLGKVFIFCSNLAVFESVFQYGNLVAFILVGDLD